MRCLFYKTICVMALSFTFSSIANAECPVLFPTVIQQDTELIQFYLFYYKLDPNRSLEDCDLESYGFPEGSTLYHVAIHLEDPLTIEYLKLARAHDHIPDANGNTAYQLYLRYFCRAQMAGWSEGKNKEREINNCIRCLRQPTACYSNYSSKL